MSAVGEALTDDDGLYSQMQEEGLWWRPVGRHINAACGSAPLLVAGVTTFMGAWQWYQSEFMAVTERKPYNRASPGENKPTALTGDGNAPLLPPAAASLHRKACHWIFGALRFPTNPVPLPPRRGRFALCLPVETCGTLQSIHSPTASAGGKVVPEGTKGGKRP